MMFKQGDILLRKFQESTTVWVAESFICDRIGSGMAEYLRVCGRAKYKKTVPPCHQSKDILPDTGKAWRYARINGQWYYDYDRIPDRRDTQYRSRLGNKEELLAAVDQLANENRSVVERELAEMVEQYVLSRMDNADLNYYRYYEVNGVCKFNTDKAKQLAEALTWLKTIREIVSEKRYKTWEIKTQSDFYALCASILHKKQLYGFSITTAESLRKKLHYFPSCPDEQYMYLISSRLGNNNARKLGKYKLVDTETGEIKRFDIHEALILKLWMNFGGPQKETKLALWGKYEQDIDYLGETALSYSTFCHYTNMYDTRLKTYAERHGWNAFKSTFLTYIPSEKLRYGNSLWCADGSGTLAYSYVDRQGVLRAMRLYVIMVSDVATGKIVGWHPAPCGQHNESPEMVRQAVLMGLRGCDRREIMEFVSDNHGAFTGGTSKDLLNSVCRKVRTIEVKNSQSNYAETQFRLFKKTIRSEFNWLGSSWDSTDIENTANEDYLKKENFPSYDEVIEQIGRKIDEWNNNRTRIGESRAELYAESIHPEAKELDERIWRKVAGFRTKQEITRQRGNIVIEKAGQKYMFEIPQVDTVSEVIRDYLGYAATVDALMYWDAECCDIYTMDDRYMFSCHASRKASLSHAEATDETLGNLGHHLQRKERMTETVSQFNGEVSEVADWIESELPPERYNIAAATSTHVKEETNGAREAYNDAQLSKGKAQKEAFKQRLNEEKTAKKEAEKAYEEYAKSKIEIDKFR